MKQNILELLLMKHNQFIMVLMAGCLWLVPGRVLAQADSLASLQEIASFQTKLNEEFRNPKESPLEAEDQKKFAGHDFFPVDLDFRVTATLVRSVKSPVFKMKTTGARTPEYRKYGELSFVIKGRPFKLNVYQSLDLMKTEQYRDYLFLPFTDLTNDSLSYGAGRYIDLRIPATGNQLVIDFNKAYNPSCAYSHRYACPVVPAENNLDIAIMAGVRFERKD